MPGENVRITEEKRAESQSGTWLLQAGVAELLYSFAFIGFGDEEIALRVHREIVRAVELSGPVAVPSERAHDFKRLAIEDVDELVRAVVDEEIRLLRVG